MLCGSLIEHPKGIDIESITSNYNNFILIKDIDIDTISPGNISFVSFNILLFFLINYDSPLKMLFVFVFIPYYYQININSKTKHILLYKFTYYK